MFADDDLLSTIDVDRISVEAPLCHTDYLTIADEERDEDAPLYQLDYPNHEVKRSLNALLLKTMVPDVTVETTSGTCRRHSLLVLPPRSAAADEATAEARGRQDSPINVPRDNGTDKVLRDAATTPGFPESVAPTVGTSSPSGWCPWRDRQWERSAPPTTGQLSLPLAGRNLWQYENHTPHNRQRYPWHPARFLPGAAICRRAVPGRLAEIC